jgi:uridylate kinase
METIKPKYKRILLKLSGEALSAGTDGILDFDFIVKIGEVLKKCTEIGVQIGIIVGAGNIWRGRQGGKMNRVRADHMGMLATTINSLALQDTFEGIGIKTKVMTAVSMQTFADLFTARDAIKAMEAGEIVIFGGGEPLTDSDGRIIGGLGVSGGSEDEDTALSAYGKRYFEEKL